MIYLHYRLAPNNAFREELDKHGDGEWVIASAFVTNYSAAKLPELDSLTFSQCILRILVKKVLNM